MADSTPAQHLAPDLDPNAQSDSGRLGVPASTEKHGYNAQSLAHNPVTGGSPAASLQAGSMALAAEQLAELRELSEIMRTGSKPHTKLEIVFVWLCQLLGIILAALFGVYTVLSFYAAEQASSQANTANQIALLSLCMGVVSGPLSPQFNGDFAAQQVVSVDNSVCGNLTFSASSVFSSLAANLFPGVALSGAPAPSTFVTTETTTGLTTVTTSTESTVLITTTSGGSISVSTSIESAPTTQQESATSTLTFTTTGAASSTALASSTPVGSSNGGGSASSPLSTAQKAAIGIGVGLGVPALLLASFTMLRAYYQLSHRSRYEIAAQENRQRAEAARAAGHLGS